jgi:PAS domain S-box-containing protein
MLPSRWPPGKRESHIPALSLSEKSLNDDVSFRILFMNNPQPMWVYDRKGNRFLEVNHAAIHRYGYSRDEFLAMRLEGSLLPKEVSRLLEDVASMGPRYTGQWRHTLKNGNLIDVEITSHPLIFRATQAELVVAHDVTEQHRLEQSLRESEELYRQFIQSVKDYAIFMLDADGCVVNWNEGAARIKGYKAEEIIGCHIARFYTAEDIQAKIPQRALQLAMENGRDEGEGWRLRKDGSRFWANVVITANRDPNGQLRGFSKITRDTTERMRANEALSVAERKYRQIFEEAIVGIFQSTPDGKLLNVNPAMARMFGYKSPGQMMASVADIGTQLYVDPTRRDEFKRLLQERDVVQHFDCQTYRRDGKKIWISVNARVVRVDGAAVRYDGTFEDINERKLLEVQLGEAEQKYRSIVDNAIFGVFQSSPEGRYITVNPAMAQMLGYESPEDLMTGVADISQQLYVDPHRRDELQVLMEKEGLVQHFEFRAYRKNGSKMWLSASIRAIRRDGVIAYYEGINEDITEYKLMEDQLRQAQKMEAVGRLAGGVAHDFNNALAVITGYSDLLQLHLSPSDPLRQHAVEVGKAGRRASALTRQLLGFSRKQVINPVILDLNSATAEMEQMLRRLIGEDIQVIFKRGPNLGRVKLDPGQVEQILMNLAVNARDAMPTGGELWLETANVELNEAFAQQNLYVTPGSYVMLSVTDTGCGIDEKTQHHIFEPFFTTKEPGKGTGLGLSTVYGIVKQNGGNLHVYSEVGKGATFTIYFPLVQESSEASPMVQRESSSLTGSENILLVEDEDALRKLARTCLEDAGYKVIEATGAAEARKIAVKNPVKIDLLVTDVVMPGGSGPELASLLKHLNPELKVLFMSGYTGDLLAQHGVLNPGTLLLEKPFTIDTLMSSVREALGIPQKNKAAGAS